MEKFYIGPMQSGLQKDVKPYLLPDTAFERLENAYLFRGRVRKRFGERLLFPTSGVVTGYESLSSRLRVAVGTTDVNGDLTVAAVPGTTVKVGALFSVSNGTTTEIFTVWDLDTPLIMLTNGASTTHTINTTTGNLIIVGSVASSTVYYYPSEPVMGLHTYETNNINNEPVYAFDTKLAYHYTANGWDRLGTATWTGDNKDFFWAETHRGISADLDVFFVTNFVAADFIKYWNGTVWANLNPAVSPGPVSTTIETARIIISFKNRLLLMNTIEFTVGAPSSVAYPSRVRFSQNGSPLAADAWREDIPGKGGWLDLPTQETIITAQHLRDRVIVYCERSTWELVYTGNQILPFVWQQINTELGCESTFSQVPFDTAVLGVGNVGIHACDGQSVKRIDELIPDEVLEIHNGDNGPERVAGIRDYVNEHVYWTFPSKDRSSLAVYPNQLLVYNYAAQTWATFDDSITAWGYLQSGNTPPPWSALTGFTWAEWTATWGDGGSVSSLVQNRNVIAGNQQGFTFFVDHDKPTNCEALQITTITAGPATLITSIEHNLKAGDFVLIQNCNGSTELNDTIFPVYEISSDDVFSIGPVSFTAYTGGGTLTRISRIDILTKQYNFYMDQSSNMHLSEVNFLVDKTENGVITVDYSTNSSSLSMNNEADTLGVSLGAPLLETSPYALKPMESVQDRLWHTLYLQGDGNCVQLRLYFTDTQMQDIPTVSSDFQWHGSIYGVQSTGRLE